MKLCIDCLTELFDTDDSCVNCGGSTLITNEELKLIKSKITSAKRADLKKLLSDNKYSKVNEYLLKKQCGDDHIPELMKHGYIEQVNPSYEKTQYAVTIDVTCPYCKSTNTKKISTTSKVVNIALFGVFGNKRNCQWHCNNCKSDF